MWCCAVSRENTHHRVTRQLHTGLTSSPQQADRTAASLHFTIKIQQSLKLLIIQKPSIGRLKMIHMK